MTLAAPKSQTTEDPPMPTASAHERHWLRVFRRCRRLPVGLARECDPRGVLGVLERKGAIRLEFAGGVLCYALAGRAAGPDNPEAPNC